MAPSTSWEMCVVNPITSSQMLSPGRSVGFAPLEGSLALKAAGQIISQGPECGQVGDRDTCFDLIAAWA